MTVRISSELCAQIVALAGASPAFEVCGLLLGKSDHVEAILPAANVATAVETQFEVDPAVLFAALRAGRAGGAAIVGNYHSHPSGLARPSVTDAAMIRMPGEIWLIVADGDVTAWRATAGQGFTPETLVLA